MKRRPETLDDLLLRTGKGPTAIAEAAGISPVTLYNWRHGRTKPRNEDLARLAKVLGHPIERVAAAVLASKGARGG